MKKPIIATEYINGVYSRKIFGIQIKKFPKLPPKNKLLTTWIEGEYILAIAENKEEGKVIIYRWNGIDKLYSDFWSFRKYA